MRQWTRLVSLLTNRWEGDSEQSILNWLTAVDYAPLQSDLISQQNVGTGQWFLGLPEFEKWLQADKQTLLCQGIPGAGKTILTSIVIDGLLSRFGNNDTVGIAYVYFSIERRQEQRAEDIFSSLLRQLAQNRPSLPESVKLLYQKHDKQRTRPTLSEVSTALQSVIALYSRVFIVIDALDKCDTSNQLKVFSEIFRIPAEVRINFFITSRFMSGLEDLFDSAISLKIWANEEDVRRYIDGHMSILPSFVHSDIDLQERLKLTIVKVIDGRFSSVQYYLGSLVDHKSPEAFEAALGRIKHAGSCI
ncbi:hypothetical protein GGR51DRAFT_431807 [Nemania sp. FL0031]|nr:hypothetical protein GGR51DRAFT_431807 [Nemania sp. FL0031]